MLRGGELSWEEQQRRERLEPEADLYSIIYTVEALEKAYVRDSISADDYTDLCRKLIGQFKTLEHMIGGISVVEFMDRHQLACPAARHRLLEIGVPATVEYMRGRESGTGNLKTAVADTVQLFITAMDALKLGMVAVDQIQPLLNDLLAAITKIPDLPSDFQAKEKTRLWLTVLHKMTASETLSDAQLLARLGCVDVCRAYRDGAHVGDAVLACEAPTLLIASDRGIYVKPHMQHCAK